MRIFLPLLLPVFALVLLVFIVAVTMLRARIAEMKRLRIHPQKFATSAGTAQLECAAIADNFRNLFEMPVLFYLLVVLLMITGQQGMVFVALAWLYVALRYVHSFIHCGYNKVIHRFYAFAASVLVLAVMWVAFGVAFLL